MRDNSCFPALQAGDAVKVRVLGVDSQGRISLSMKAWAAGGGDDDEDADEASHAFGSKRRPRSSWTDGEDADVDSAAVAGGNDDDEFPGLSRRDRPARIDPREEAEEKSDGSWIPVFEEVNRDRDPCENVLELDFSIVEEFGGGPPDKPENWGSMGKVEKKQWYRKNHKRED